MAEAAGDFVAAVVPYLYLQPTLRQATIELFVPTYAPSFRATPTDQEAISNIAEPLSRPSGVHRYRITPFSLGAAVSSGMRWQEVCAFLRSRCVNWECIRGELGGSQPSETTTVQQQRDGKSASGAISIDDNDDVANQKDDTFGNLEHLVEEQLAIGADPTHPISAFIKACMVPYGKTTINFGADGKCYIQCVGQQLLAQLVGDPIIGSQCSVDPATGAIKVTAHRREEQDLLPDSVTGGDNRYYRAQLADAIACKVVSERCLRLGYPCFQDYAYRHDTVVPAINCDLRVGTHPRPYQVAAVEASAKFGKCRSGVLVLPCGAGKTLVGVMMVAAVKRRTLIVCAGSVSVTQWKNQILDFATLGAPTALRNSSKGAATLNNNNDSPQIAPVGSAPSTLSGEDGSTYKPVRTGIQRIAVVTSKEKTAITEDTDIVITTYTMLGVAKKLLDRLSAQVRASQKGSAGTGKGTHTGGVSDEVPLEAIFASNTTMSPSSRSKLQMFNPFGLVVLDEVHVVPAEYFKDALSSLKTKATIGLTATFVREDHRIESLHHLIGAKLYDVGWQELAKSGYLARVMCVEVNCPITREFGLEYTSKQKLLEAGRRLRVEEGGAARRSDTGNSRMHDTTPMLVMLAAANPNKMKTVLQLVAAHRSDKVLLFCDHILLLKVYAQLLNCPVVSGETSHKDRLMIFSDFQAVGGKSCNIICISRVGDVSVNLPSANVVIQVSSHGGSRRQEAQRLGRVLRPKDSVAIIGARQKALAGSFPTTSESEWLRGVLDRGDAADANAYFYSLVTEFSVEVPYATRRSEFLVDQGYPFYAVLAPPPTQAPPTAFKAKLESSGYSMHARSAAQQRSGSSTINRPQKAMAPVAIPDAAVDDIWSVEWQLRFLARIISGWEIKFFAASTAEAEAYVSHSATTLVTGDMAPLGSKRMREADDSGDAFDRSHVGIPMLASPAAVTKAEVKAEDTAVAPTSIAALSGLVLADDVVYHEL